LQPAEVDGVLVLYAPNAFVQEAVSSNYLRSIKSALPKGMGVQLAVGSRPKPTPPKSPARSQERQPDSESTSAPAKSMPTKSVRRNREVVEREPGYFPSVWGEFYRAIPNEFVRTAMFTINRYGKDTKRPRRERQLMFSQKNITMYVTGEETNQADLDVLMQLTHYQRNVRVGNYFSFSARQVLEDLDRPLNGRSHAELIASINRLMQTTVEFVSDDRKVSAIQLISEFHRDEAEPSNAQSWHVKFPPVVLELFSKDRHTRLVWEQSQMLRSSLAKSMHRYLSSHRQPYPLTTEFLHKLSGTHVTELRKFRASLKEALDELVEARFLVSWSYDPQQDKFTFKRSRHLLEELPQSEQE